MVLTILLIAAAFVLLHLLLLLRVLQEVHSNNDGVLWLPVYGLAASAGIGGVAIGLNKLSEVWAPPKKALK